MAQKVRPLFGKLGLLLMGWLFTNNASAANTDSLTNRQIYNFSIGDTFVYQYKASGDVGPGYTTYGYKILQQKIYSTDTDSIYYGFSPYLSSTINEWDTITNLDSIAVNLFHVDSPWTAIYSSDSLYLYPPFVTNGIDLHNFELDTTYGYTARLGQTSYGYGQPDEEGGGCDCYGWKLVYFSNGNLIIGAIPTSISVIKSTTKIDLYPNPTKDICKVQLNGGNQFYSASLFDVTGREISTVFSNGNFTNLSFDISSLPTGLYFVKVTDASGQMSINKLEKD